MTSYKYIGIDIHRKLDWNYSIEKMINGGWKAYFGLENNYKSTNLVMWDKKKFLFETLVIHVILYLVKYGGATFLENLGGRLNKYISGL